MTVPSDRPDPVYVCRLRSNVKSGVDAGLSPLTLVVGRNASGKSAVVEALTLALAGRSVETASTPAELLTLCAEPPLVVEASFSDDRRTVFTVEGTTARGHKPTREGDPPPAAILTSEVADLLRRDQKTIRRALLKIAAGDLDTESLVAEIPTALRDLWSAAWREARLPAEGDADALAAVPKVLRAWLRKKRSEAKVADDLGPRPEAPAEDDVADLLARWRRVEARETEELRLEMEAHARLRAQAAQAARAAQPSVTPPPGDPNVVARRPDGLRGAERAILFALIVADAHQKGEIPCFCGQRHPVGVLRAVLDKIREKIPLADEAARRLVAYRAAKGQAPIPATAAEEEAPPVETRVESDDPPAAELRAAYDEARAALDAARRWNEARAAAVKAAAEADLLGGLVKIAERLVADRLNGVLAAFEKAVLRFAGQPVRVELFDGDRAVCRVGFVSSDSVVPFRALSGAERARLAVAFAAAWGAGRPEPIRLAIVDDVWLDAESLSAICAALAEAVETGALTQAVVCAVESGAAPGWTRVEAGRVPNGEVVTVTVAEVGEVAVNELLGSESDEMIFK